MTLPMMWFGPISYFSDLAWDKLVFFFFILLLFTSIYIHFPLQKWGLLVSKIWGQNFKPGQNFCFDHLMNFVYAVVFLIMSWFIMTSEFCVFIFVLMYVFMLYFYWIDYLATFYPSMHSDYYLCAYFVQI